MKRVIDLRPVYHREGRLMVTYLTDVRGEM
jgi:hypothetical protein